MGNRKIILEIPEMYNGVTMENLLKIKDFLPKDVKFLVMEQGFNRHVLRMLLYSAYFPNIENGIDYPIYTVKSDKDKNLSIYNEKGDRVTFQYSGDAKFENIANDIILKGKSYLEWDGLHLYHREYLVPEPSTEQNKSVCTCGSSSVKSPKHSDWCNVK